MEKNLSSPAKLRSKSFSSETNGGPPLESALTQKKSLRRDVTIFNRQRSDVEAHGPAPDGDFEYISEVIDILEGQNASTNLRDDPQYANLDYLIIFPDDFLKSIWDIIIAFLMLYTCIITPYRVAFLSDEDEFLYWIILETTIDVFFSVDIILNFFVAFFDAEEILIVSKKRIIKNYLLGWFSIDLIGVIPFDKILETTKYSTLVRLSRIPRLYKLFRLTKMLKVLRMIKERNKIITFFLDFLKIGQGLQRMLSLIISILLFCHVTSCLWVLQADINEDGDDWITMYRYRDSINSEIYVASFYWITQTVVTVGYGDIAARNTTERLFSITLMFFGAFLYSFTIGTNIDLAIFLPKINKLITKITENKYLLLF